MAKRKPAANRGRNERAASAAKTGGRSASSKAPAGKSSAPAKATPAKTTRTKATERKAASRPAAAGKKLTAQKKRAERRPGGAEGVKTSRLGPATGSVSANKNGRTVAAAGAAHETEAPLRKSPLSESDLAEFRELLLEKRRELVGDMNNMTDEARRTGSVGSTMSSMPIHMADLGSDTWEQELTLGLIENERNLLREIDDALARIANKTYGVCIATNKPIGKARLRFKPWAKHCIEYARKMEQGRA